MKTNYPDYLKPSEMKTEYTIDVYSEGKGWEGFMDTYPRRWKIDLNWCRKDHPMFAFRVVKKVVVKISS